MALGTRVQFDQSGDARSSGVLAVLSERLSDTIDRGVNYLLSLQASEGYWIPRTGSRHHARIRLHFFICKIINKANPGAHRQAGELCAAPAVGRWRLEYLLWRPFRAECND